MLIGLTGKAGSGKSFAAERLIKMRGFERIKFADPLKDMLRALGLNEHQIEGGLKEQPCTLLCGMTPRFAMQTLGTEWGRNTIGPDFWINIFCHRFLSGSIHRNVVCDDVRFKNEADTIRRLGGYIVHIRTAVESVAHTHASEIFDLTYDSEILNDFTPKFGELIDRL